jgi:hypothetical protein
MKNATTQSMMGVLGGAALALGLSGVASGQGAPPPAGPLEDIQATLDVILDWLDDLQQAVDNLPGALGPCEVRPVWGQTYATADRFVPVFGGVAFCDKATGLVWDGSSNPATQVNSQNAISNCLNRTVGGQQGFHLPLIEQLASLTPLLANDLNSATGDGPFTGVQPAGYWSATTYASDPADGLSVGFGSGTVGASPKGNVNHHVWCARGGQTYDGQDVLNAVP